MKLLLMVALLLAGCSLGQEAPPRPAEPTAATDLIFRRWEGDPLRGCPIEITFEEKGRLGGTAGQDGFGGNYNVASDMLTVTDLQSPGTSRCERQVRDWLAQPLPVAVAGMRLDLGSDRFRTDDIAVSTFAASLPGLSEGFAQRLVETSDLQLRVVERDGVSLPIHLDFRADRIDVAVDQGLVIRASVG